MVPVLPAGAVAMARASGPPFPWLLLMVSECRHREGPHKEAVSPLCSYLLRLPHAPFQLPRPCNSPFKSASCEFVALELLEETKIQKSRFQTPVLSQFFQPSSFKRLQCLCLSQNLERKSLTNKATCRMRGGLQMRSPLTDSRTSCALMRTMNL